MKFPDEQRHVILHSLPDNLKVDIAVVMYHAVPHSGDLMERDAWELSAGFGRKPGRGFASDEEAPQDGILRLGIIKELVASLVSDVRLNGRHRPENIEQVRDLPSWDGSPPLIAVIEDEGSVRKALGRLLRSAGLSAHTYASGEEFLPALPHRLPDCLLLDLDLR